MMMTIFHKRKLKKMCEKNVRVKHLIMLGWTVKDIAKKMKMSEEEVRHFMYL